MAIRLTDERCKIIAENYCNNGYNKTQALKDAEYSPSYARSGRGLKIYDDARVKAHITAIIEEKKEKAVATRMQRQQFWTETYQDTSHNISDRLRASELLGRSEADFTDNINNKAEKEPDELSDQELAELKRAAIAITNTKRNTDDEPQVKAG